MGNNLSDWFDYIEQRSDQEGNSFGPKLIAMRSAIRQLLNRVEDEGFGHWAEARELRGIVEPLGYQATQVTDAGA